jgi:hypothetical protein
MPSNPLRLIPVLIIIFAGCLGPGGTGDSASSAAELRARMPSANGTTIPPASRIVDASRNVWKVSSGVVTENGAPAGYSANVTLLLYQDGVIYQQNAAGDWWSWNGSGWDDASDPRSGSTGTPPGGGNTGPTESADGTSCPPAQSITDAQGGLWTVSGGVIQTNGQNAGYSADVTLLLYFNHTVYQQNAAGGWWLWSGSGWSDAADPRVGAPGGGNTSGSFHVSLNGFTDNNGHAWRMRGLNATVDDALQGFGNVLIDYPGLSAIRLNCDPGSDSDQAIDQVVQLYTGRGVIVEIEDHADTNNGDNVGWYQRMAQSYKTNPRVFLEVPNEPSDPNTAQYEIDIINAIRAQGFDGPVGLQALGGYDFSNYATVIGAVGTTQIFAAPHIYYDGTDPNGAANYVSGDIQTSRDFGLFAVIDEFGDAMDGWNRDPLGASTIAANVSAEQSGSAGAIFWAMDNGNHPDGTDSAFLTTDGSQLTPVGQTLQSWLQ